MSENDLSSPVISNQSGPYARLAAVVEKHLTTRFQRPAAAHTRMAFDQIRSVVQCSDKPIILDSGCGTGESSIRLAKRHPDSLVLAIDQSAHRLNKIVRQDLAGIDNLNFIRADMVDFYALAAADGWRLTAHKVYYPNPWPKADSFKRRWHGSPVFPHMLALGGALELRTNWPLYAEEFAEALKLAGQTPVLTEIDAIDPISNFERKYERSGHKLVKLECSIDRSRLRANI